MIYQHGEGSFTAVKKNSEARPEATAPPQWAAWGVGGRTSVALVAYLTDLSGKPRPEQSCGVYLFLSVLGRGGSLNAYNEIK